MAKTRKTSAAKTTASKKPARKSTPAKGARKPVRKTPAKAKAARKPVGKAPTKRAEPPEQLLKVIDQEARLRETLSKCEAVKAAGPSTSSNETYDAIISGEEYSHHVWDLTDSYFSLDNRGLQSQAIASFNSFVNETLPKMIVKCGRVSVEDVHNALTKSVHKIEITQVYIERQVVLESFNGQFFPLYPHEARSRGLTYSSPVYADFRYSVFQTDAAGFTKPRQNPKMTPKLKICDIPIMVKSEFCRLHGKSPDEIASRRDDPDDPGGYFIINGLEKVIITQERPANNKLFLFKPMCDSKYQFECELRSTVDSTTEKVAALWIHIPGNPKSFKNFKDGRPRPIRASLGKNQSLHKSSVRAKITKNYDKMRPGLVVTLARVRGTIPLGIFFKAMGFETDGEIWETFMATEGDMDFVEALRNTMENPESLGIKSQNDALFYIGRRSINEAPHSHAEVVDQGRKVINEEVLPSLGDEEICDRLKGYHIGYMVNRLIFAYLSRIQCDDRDHLQNKRFDLAGAMLANLVKNQIRSLMSDARQKMLRRLARKLDIDLENNFIRRNSMTMGITYAMSTGNWGDSRKFSNGRVGVCQPLNRLTRLATLSNLRRIDSPVNRLIRTTPPRMVHPTGFGFICPVESPEGENVGLLKALSVMAEISEQSDTRPVLECLRQFGYQKIDDFPDKLGVDTKIFLNAEIIGTCPPGKEASLVKYLKTCRQQFDEVEEAKKKLKKKDSNLASTYRGISNQISIVHDCECREIRIRTDAGRAFRPLLVVQDNKLMLRLSHIRRLLDSDDSYSWKNLILDGVIEFLDAAESETAMIAMFPGDLDGSSGRNSVHLTMPSTYKVSYTHCEIHPSMILGVAASLIPFPNHNQSPRNSYQAGMSKQAVGVPPTNYFSRWETESHLLHYPQRPLVTTKTAKFINYDSYPAGINTITAILAYTGYNQEDAVIINKSAVQRGLFRSTLFKVKSDEARTNVKHGEMDEQFEIPRKGEVANIKSSFYAHLEADGLPEVGTIICDDEALIGKTQGLAKDCRGPAGPSKIDASVMFRSSIASRHSIVDSVMITNNAKGHRQANVRTRNLRKPQIGDKFSSRHGQKGVVGMDFHETDLPFTKDGIVPELIMNPHAIPSRMTIGHLLETVTSKESALSGRLADATCFTQRESPQEIGTGLEKFGFQKHGMEVMYNGMTGRKMHQQTFIGPVYYQRLKHMVEDKVHFRTRGPITYLCRQPVPGIQRDGGLRFGEMERDAIISHGAASFLREKLFILSDYYSTTLCRNCGAFLSQRQENRDDSLLHLKCRLCRRTPQGTVSVALPYACKLFFQELMSMNIRVKIEMEEEGKGLAVPPVESCSKATPPSILETLINKMDADTD